MTSIVPPPFSTAPAAVLVPVQVAFGDFADEFASTRRVLARYPDGSGTWRPHEKSRTLSEVATHVAAVVNHGTSILMSDDLDVATRKPSPNLDSAAELLAFFDANVGRFNEAFASITPDLLAQTWTLHAGPKVILQRDKGSLLRFLMMSHQIHHRAQLGVYYRLLGVVVPGVYGPSADE